MANSNEGAIGTALATAIKRRNAFLNGNTPANDNIPQNAEGRAKLKADLQKAMQTETEYKKELNSQQLTPDEYIQKQKQAYKVGCDKLDIELILCKMLLKAKTNQGKKTGVESERDKLIKEFDLTAKQARLIMQLDADAVEAAKAQAYARGEVPNRSMALTLKRTVDNTRYIVPFKSEGKFAECYPENVVADDFTEPVLYTQLFACTGMGEYFLPGIGWHSAVANELVQERADWYSEIYPSCHMIVGSITDNNVQDEIVSEHIKHGCRAVFGSPVCRKFSKAGDKKYDTLEAKLYMFMLKILWRIKRHPQGKLDAVLIENVPEFLSARPIWLQNTRYQNIGEHLQASLQKMGLCVNVGELNAADYGVCQTRHRCFICASKGEKWLLPKPDERRLMLWEVIGHLKSLEAGESDPTTPYHSAPTLPATTVEALKLVPTGGSVQQNPSERRLKKKNGDPGLARFKSCGERNKWDETWATVTQNNDSVSAHTSIHPGRPRTDGTWTDARPATLAEILLITGVDLTYPIPKWVSEKLAREACGECIVPRVLLRLILECPVQKHRTTKAGVNPASLF